MKGYHVILDGRRPSRSLGPYAGTSCRPPASPVVAQPARPDLPHILGMGEPRGRQGAAERPAPELVVVPPPWSSARAFILTLLHGPAHRFNDNSRCARAVLAGPSTARRGNDALLFGEGLHRRGCRSPCALEGVEAGCVEGSTRRKAKVPHRPNDPRRGAKKLSRRGPCHGKGPPRLPMFQLGRAYVLCRGARTMSWPPTTTWCKVGHLPFELEAWREYGQVPFSTTHRAR